MRVCSKMKGLALIILLILGLAWVVYGQPSLVDANALITLKTVIWVDPNNVLADWTLPVGVTNACGFTGITCDPSNGNRVTRIELPSQQLRGIVHQQLQDLTYLTVFNLTINEFMGDIPDIWANLPYLQYLDFSHNMLTGYIPEDLITIQQLVVLNLGSNQLSGGLIDLDCRVLSILDFSNNTLEGGIPYSYAVLPALRSLDLGNNMLVGYIPPLLGKTGNLFRVNLSSNYLTGKIPKHLALAPGLTEFTVQYNLLTGKIPVTPTMKRFSPKGFRPGNTGLCGPVLPKEPCPRPPTWWKVIVGALIPSLLIAGAIYLYRLIPPGEYTARSIVMITDDFNHSNIIGSGSFCTVYKGLTRQGKTVAVKRLRPEYYKHKRRMFERERRALMDVKHPNIVRVKGSCCTRRLKVLVLEYMCNGNLEMHLRQAEPPGELLNWKARLDIACGVGQGLAYLHGEFTGSRSMHCDVKASAILFDDKFIAHLTDIRLASINDLDDTCCSNAVGYMAPEYLLTRICTTKAEVYSYGTLVLELVTGKKPEQAGLHGMVRDMFPYSLHGLIDQRLAGDMMNPDSLEQLTRMLRVGLLCTNELPQERPSMQEVLYMLGQAYSPPRSMLNFPGWVMLAIGVAEEDWECSPWTKVPLPLWLMMLLGLAQEWERRFWIQKKINENVKKCVYAVRGELYLRASELQKEGKKIIFTNVGNPHALGQKPLTFPRQVMALCQAPFLMEDPNVSLLFPPDAIARAKHYLSITSGGLGAYSDSRGIPGVRQEVAEFLLKRDGHPSDPEHIFLTDGASKGVMMLLNALIRNGKDGVLVPIPQYPLYSASIALYGGVLIPYYLQEESNWSLDITDIRNQLSSARSKNIIPRALVFINPGNPTGQCLSKSNLQDLIKLCYQDKLVLMADEVYQVNVYQDDRPFISAKKVLMDMGLPYSNSVELVSFHTVSKGFLGECGQRGGYFELTNIHPQTVEELYKVASISLSPNVPGQVMMGLMVSPPKPSDHSYPQYQAESNAIIESMRRRAHIMTDGFNKCQDVQCNFTEGAMYSFPQIKLPRGAIDEAKRRGKAPDVFYCIKLLEATGISTVPGSGFGQKDGTLHLRTTILPSEQDMPEIMAKFQKFHADFMAQYSSCSRL